ncbi:MAG TPA: serine hydrolase [Chloroflexia bacterium]|nr:serine hydrolase [Chloroflexia bacterium]
MISENTILNSRYRLDKKIGQGGFAQVFLGTDLVLERRVAVKVLNTGISEEENFLERFEREAKAIAVLDHPNILTVHDYGHVEDTAFLVMPYIEGGTLHDKLRRDKRLSLQEAGYYLQQVAAALDYAHRRNIVHRDIKPQNMLLREEDNHLFLADFGIAKVLGSSTSQSHTSALGTLSYMSPEQLGGNVGRATDIYALGCVLFQMLTGQLPYSGPTEQVVIAHLTAPVPSIAERSQGQVPPELQPVIDRALAKKPEDRYQTAGEMASAFQVITSRTGTNKNYALNSSEAEGTIALNPNLPPRSATPTRPHGPTSAPSDATVVSPNPTPARPYYGQNQQAPSVNPVAQQQAGTPPRGYAPQYPPQGYPPAGTPPQGYPPAGTPPPGYIRPAQIPAPRKSNALLFGIGGAVLALVVAGIILLVVLNGNKNNPQNNTTPTVQAAVTATGDAATTAGSEATPTTEEATTTSEATTSAAANTPEPSPEPTTAEATTVAATTTAAPTDTPVPPTNTPAPAISVNENAIKAAMAALPGTTSVTVVLPDGKSVTDDPQRQLPSASTIKLWIAATAYEEAKAGRLNLSEQYTVKQSDIASGTGILVNNVGKTYTYEQIISTMLIYSDNSAANIMIDKLGGPAGFDKVNSYAQRFGYTQTKLQRRLGDVSNPNNNFTCSQDAANYLQHLIKGEIVDKNASDHIMAALKERLSYAQDQNYFGTLLPPDVDYRHISGTGTRIRNEFGYYPVLPGKYVIITIMVNDAPEADEEAGISAAIQKINDAIKR